MTRIRLAMTLACAPLIGCSIPNPAFDPDAGRADDGTTTYGDGDGDPSTTDADTLDDGMESSESDGTVADLPPDEACVPQVHQGLLPRYGAPENFDGGMCRPSVATNVKVHGTEGGNLLAYECPQDCSYCPEGNEIVIGAEALALGALVAPLPIPSDPLTTLNCYYVEAVGSIGDDPNVCRYSSLSLHLPEALGRQLVFNANRDSVGLTPLAAEQLAWTPGLVDIVDVDQCLCEEGLGIECCLGQMVVSHKFEVGPQTWIYPGTDGPAQVGNLPYTFFAAQAQSGTNCNTDPETSWALFAPFEP